MSGNRQGLLCLVLAMAAPLAHYTGQGYMAVLLAAGAMIPLTTLAGDGMNRISKPVAALELIWLGLMMGSLIRVSGANWPGEKSEVVVPLALLLLGVVTGNREKGARVCCTLFWIGLIPALWILAVLMGKTEPKWLTPEPGVWTGSLIAVFLYPVIITSEKGVSPKTGGIVGLMAVLLAVIIQGGLGTRQALMEESPLYELGRCVGKGGFEIVISVVMTISWYGFVCMGMGAAERLGKKMNMDTLPSRITTTVFGILGMYSSRVWEDEIMLYGALLMWILVPILHVKK